jgi:4-alpha-glucanotransferase
LAVQLYALRSCRNWGHGDFTDLARLIALAAAQGASAIGLNPLHVLFLDRPEQASPYAPNSRLFLNPLYIDVEAVPEFPGLAATGFESDIAALRETKLVNYTGVARAKLMALRAAYDRFRAAASGDQRADFDAFRHEQGDALLRFACFECLRLHHAPRPWPQWPQPWRRADSASLQAFRHKHHGDCEFHEFLQWIADRQLRACQQTARHHGMPIGLYVDVAVGIDPHGADAWSQQDTVLADVSVGAPPDEFNPGGQDWGLAPINPNTIARDDFAAMRQLMRAAMRHAGAIRLDHVLGLKRIFMIPRGADAHEGAYVRYPFEQLLRVVAEESQRARCVVIGEDLGTVPEGFRETTSHWGLWSYRVMLFERDHEGRFRPPETYPANALATFNTHDLPTHRGWLSGHDLQVKRAIGVDPGETDEQRRHAHHMLRAILGERVPGYAADDFAAVAAFLGATPSRLVSVALDDILGAVDQVNIPGTVDQHPNWRRKLPMTIEDLERQDSLSRVAQAFMQAGRSCAV